MAVLASGWLHYPGVSQECQERYRSLRPDSPHPFFCTITGLGTCIKMKSVWFLKLISVWMTFTHSPTEYQ